MSVAVEISFGDLIDKITILEIKAGVVRDAVSRRNILYELAMLRRSREQALPGSSRLDLLQEELRAINRRLWTIEGRLRAKEREQQFDQEFIDLARGVYLNNDQRSQIKRTINQEFQSTVVEEKIFSGEM